MEYLPAILKGLMMTLFIALISLSIAAIPGSLLFWGKKSKVKILYWLCTTYIEVFEGIPLLAQLFSVYYALPLILPDLVFSPFFTAIFVLSINAIANIASLAKSQAESVGNPSNFTSNIKIVILSLIKEFGRLIKYTSLLSVIGLTDLLREANMIMMSMNDVIALIIAIIIYLILSIGIKLVYKGLKKVFFEKEI